MQHDAIKNQDKRINIWIGENMTNKIYVATNNKGKLKEIKAIFSDFEVLSIKDLGFDFDVEEDGKTFSENSYKKAKALYNLTKCAVIADDSGLCVDALDGEPGVYSARYAGEHGNDVDNTEKLLYNMKDISKDSRNAKFVCDICYINESGDVFHAYGECHGEIAYAPKGENGFGYDPIMYIPELNKTMAELSPDEKNKISHRAKALAILKEKLLK